LLEQRFWWRAPLPEGSASISRLPGHSSGRPAILLFDEATSALDAVTEGDIHASLTALRCTRIVIAHRLSTVRRADLILVMDNGEIIESGMHHELLARGGMYAELVHAQLEGAAS
jgi:ABC-type multidrug transport system fused ATPase/permease subunit